MKKLLFLFIVGCLLGSCESNILPQDCVRQIELTDVCKITSCKYKVTTSSYYFYTNIKYTIGDTLCLTIHKQDSI